jgi:predicted amidohydrolase
VSARAGLLLPPADSSAITAGATVAADAGATATAAAAAAAATAAPPPRSRVLLLQEAPARDAAAGAALIERALLELGEATAATVGLVVLPEGFVREVLLSTSSSSSSSSPSSPGAQQQQLPAPGSAAPPELAPYAALAARHGVPIVCGTMCEPAPPRAPEGGGGQGHGERFYTTCVVVGPGGEGRGCVVGAYRKRRIHSVAHQAAGDAPLVFDAGGAIGRVGVLVCLDAEDAELVEELRGGEGVRVIVNPTHIPVPSATRGGGGGAAAADAARMQWRVAVGAMARSFEWRCSSSSSSVGFHLLRCDTPFPGGMGSSQAIGPERTLTAGSMHPEVLLVDVATAPGAAPLLTGAVPAASYARTAREEGCGARALLDRVRVCRRLPPGGGGGGGGAWSVRALRFAYPADAPRGKLLVLLARATTAGGGGVEEEAAAHAAVAVVDVARRVVESGPADEVAAPLRAHAAALISDFAASSSGGGGGGQCGGWVDEERRVLLRVGAGGALELARRRSDGSVRAWKAIPTTEPVGALAVNHLGGGFATAGASTTLAGASWPAGEGALAGAGAVVTLWSFAHNCIPARLAEFLAVV